MAIKTINLLEDRRECRGYWWHPEDRNARVAGTLLYSGERGFHLELLGVLDRVRPDQDPPEIITLHGHLIEGEVVTLHKVFLTAHLPRWPGIFTQRFSVGRAFFGAHLNNVDAYAFPSCSFRLSYLEEWLSYQPLRHDLHEGYPFAMDVSLRTMSGEFERVEYLDAEIRVASSFTTKDRLPRNFEISSHAWLVVRPTTPKPLDWYLTVVSRIRNLVTLCLPQPTSIEELKLNNADNEELTLVYGQVPSARPVDPARAWPVLQGDQLGESFASTIGKWMELYDKAHHALQVFFIAIFGPIQYISDRFLLLAKALEVHHRRRGESYFMDPEAYSNEIDNLKGALPASFPKDLRYRICATLQSLNEYPFGKRLKELDEDILTDIGLVRLPSKIRRRIVDTRNYFTHFSEDRKTQVKDRPDMHDLNERMILVTIVLLFHELGVPRDAVREFLQHRPNLRRFLEEKEVN